MKQKSILISIVFVFTFSLSYSQTDICSAKFCYTAVLDSANNLVVNFVNQSSSTYPIVNHYWEFGDGLNDTVINPVHSHVVYANYIVNHYVFSASTCVGIFADTIYLGTTCDSPVGLKDL